MLDLKPLPMEDAIIFWKNKYPLSYRQYRQLTDEVKTKSFAVTGIAKGDELTTVFNALQRALEEGTTFDEFKKDVENIFERRGWTGKTAWRVETIFRTNIQTAYNVGRYKEMLAVRGSRPYWQYSAVNDTRTRPTHWAMNGKIFPANHPVWDTWYPPNGFNCRCGVVTLSQDDIDTEGLKVETKSLPKTLTPDAGFAHNPGKDMWGGIAPKENEQSFTNINTRNYADYGRQKLENLPESGYIPYRDTDILPSGLPELRYYEAFANEFPPGAIKQGVFTDKTGDAVIVSKDLFTTAGRELKITKRGREQYMKLLARTIQNPYEIWLTPMKDNKTGRIVLRKRFIRAFTTPPGDRMTGAIVFEYGNDGWSAIMAFPPGNRDYINGLRNGVLLYKE